MAFSAVSLSLGVRGDLFPRHFPQLCPQNQRCAPHEAGPQKAAQGSAVSGAAAGRSQAAFPPAGGCALRGHSHFVCVHNDLCVSLSPFGSMLIGQAPSFRLRPGKMLSFGLSKLRLHGVSPRW